MKKVNLSQNEIEFLRSNVLNALDDFSVELFFFGSRVKGSNSKYSDIDLLLRANNYSEDLIQEVSKINEILISSNFPYKVDLVLECDLANSYKDEIYKDIVLFTRD